jgi:hypothetical protein
MVRYTRAQLALLDTTVSADTTDVFKIKFVGEKDPMNGSVWPGKGREENPYQQPSAPSGSEGAAELVYQSSCNFFPGKIGDPPLRKSAWAMEQSKAAPYTRGTRHVQDNSLAVVQERNRRKKAHAHALQHDPRAFFRRKMKEPHNDSETHNVKTKKDIGHLVHSYSWPTKKEQKSPPPGAYPKWPEQEIAAKDRQKMGWTSGHARSTANMQATRKFRSKIRSNRSNQRDENMDSWGASSRSNQQPTVNSRLATYIDQDALMRTPVCSSTQMAKTWHDTRMLRNAVGRDHRMRMEFCRSAKKEELKERREIEQRLSQFESNFKKLQVDSSKTLYADEESDEDEDEGR